MSQAAPEHSGRVTVVIPTYNRARLVPRAIRSALAQTAANACDIVVVDDGSSDDTPRVLAAFGSAITVVPQRHAGVSAARNAGIRTRPSEFVAFLDSDDTWEPDKIERQLAALRAHPAAVFVAGQILVCAEAGAVRPMRLPVVPTNEPADLAPHVLWDNFLATSAMMVRTAALAETGLFRCDLNCCEDYHLWARLACRGPGIVLDVPLVTYHHGSPGALTRDPVHLLASQLRVRYLLAGELRRRPDCRAQWRAGLARCQALLRDEYYRAGYYGRAWRYAVRSLLHQPLGRPRWEWGRVLDCGLRAMLSSRRRAPRTPSGRRAPVARLPRTAAHRRRTTPIACTCSGGR